MAKEIRLPKEFLEKVEENPNSDRNLLEALHRVAIRDEGWDKVNNENPIATPTSDMQDTEKNEEQ